MNIVSFILNLQSDSSMVRVYEFHRINMTDGELLSLGDRYHDTACSYKLPRTLYQNGFLVHHETGLY